MLAPFRPWAGAKARGSGDSNTRGPRVAGEEPAVTLLGVRSSECACFPSCSTPALDLGQFCSAPPTTQVLRLKEDPLTENILLADYRSRPSPSELCQDFPGICQRLLSCQRPGVNVSLSAKPGVGRQFLQNMGLGNLGKFAFWLTFIEWFWRGFLFQTIGVCLDLGGGKPHSDEAGGAQVMLIL